MSATDRDATLAVPDRTPQLRELIHVKDLKRCLDPFLAGAVDGSVLFDREGSLYGGAMLDSCPMTRWEQLPPEVGDVLRRGVDGVFGLSDHVFDVRSMYAGTERVALMVVSRVAATSTARDEGVVTGLSVVLGQLLQSGFATWVTSEMHLATSESTFRALSRRNDDLERAVNHLRELDELKSNFLATVSHELRTPLTSVIGFSEMLLEGLAGELSSDQAEYVRTILKRGEELLTLISQVLEMSRLEVGAERLTLVRHDLRRTVKASLEVLELAAHERGVTLVDATDPAIPLVLADPAKLHRVLINLVGNAIKFSKPGGQISVRAQAAPIRRPFREETLFGEEADDALRVTVQDDGIGIPADKLGRIFEAFFQVDAGPTRAHGGAGLGLSIVRNLVQAHGGDVWVESELTVGTAVHFTLPLASSAAAEAG